MKKGRKDFCLACREDVNYHFQKLNITKVIREKEYTFRITITRYLAGQMPSKEYSDIIRRALASPACMKKLLIQNKEKIASDECQLIDRIIGSYGLYGGKVMEMITHKEDPWLEMRD